MKNMKEEAKIAKFHHQFYKNPNESQRCTNYKVK